MFTLLGTEKVSGVKGRFFKHENVNNDPYFCFDLRKYKDGFVLLYLKVLEGAAFPKLYLDTGGGFNEENLILLSSSASLYHIPLGKIANLKAVRFDPSESDLRFFFVPIYTKSVLLAGILSFLLNRKRENGASGVGPQSLLLRVVTIIRDAPSFFRWIKSSDSLYALSRRATIPLLFEHMSTISSGHASNRFEIIGSNRSYLIDFICPVYNAKVKYLKQLASSFIDQQQSDCRLILSDDNSNDLETISFLKDIEFAQDNICVVWSDENSGISNASNRAIAKGLGKWIAFIDHDDAMSPNAIGVVKDAMKKFPSAKFFYTDEYIADDDLEVVDIFCKPAYDAVLLTGMNYINHFSIYSRESVLTAGLLDPRFDGSQDYELLLRSLAGLKDHEIVHIPFPAYIWRRPAVSYSVENIVSATDRARLALVESFRRSNEKVEVFPALKDNLHKVVFREEAITTISIVIPNKNSFDLINQLLLKLVEFDTEIHEIIVVDNGSDRPEIFELYRNMKTSFSKCTFDFILKEEAFNFSTMCNRGYRASTGDNILFLNNDIEIIDRDWLSEMRQCLKFSGTGVVGAKLLYPSGVVQHHGVIVGLGGYAGHWYVGADSDTPGPMGRFFVRQSMTAVTGACMLVTRRCFTDVGGFDEIAFPIAYNDVDFCIKANQKGYRIVFTPFAVLVHHESQTRGLDDTVENTDRFEGDKARLEARYNTKTYDDAAYSPLYGRWQSYPIIRLPASLPKPRLNRISNDK